MIKIHHDNTHTISRHGNNVVLITIAIIADILNVTFNWPNILHLILHELYAKPLKHDLNIQKGFAT